MSLESNKRIKSIDGLRGLAILLVVAFHTYSHPKEYIPWVTIYKDFFILKFGYMGVELFFMISGFVILMTLERSNSFKEFIIKRWLRLFPAMLIATILIYATSFFLLERPLGKISYIDFLPGLFFIDPDIFSGNSVFNIGRPIELAFWSLFVEVKFYFIFGALYFYNKKTALKNLIIVFLSFFTIYCIKRLAHSENIDSIYTYLNLYFSLQYFGWFCIGAIMYKSYSLNDKLMAYRSAYLIIPAYYCSTRHAYIAALLIYTLFYFTLNNKKVCAIIGNRFLIFFGVISYPLYLIHENAMVALTIKTHNQFGFIPDLLTPLPGLLIIFLIAYFIAKHLEPNLKSFIRKFIYLK